MINEYFRCSKLICGVILMGITTDNNWIYWEGFILFFFVLFLEWHSNHTPWLSWIHSLIDLVRSSWIWIYKECGSHDLVNKWQYVSNMLLSLVVHINFFCICFCFSSNMERLAENIVQMGLNLGKSTRKADAYIACHIYIDTNYTNCNL